MSAWEVLRRHRLLRLVAAATTVAATLPLAFALTATTDEDIAKMESRKTPIQEQEDDEYIATPDTLTPSSFPRCNSFPISYHVTLGFSKYVVIVLIITSSYDIETGWSWTCWKGDNDAVDLDLVPALDYSWINLYVHDKVLCHLFWANLVMYRIWALSPCCGRLPLVASNPRSLLLYIPCSRRCLDSGFV